MAKNNLLSERNVPIDPEEAQLLEEYEQLAMKYHKQQLILSVMKDMRSNEMKDVDEIAKKNIDKALDFVRAFDYIRMDIGTTLLGLSDRPHELSYVEKRALKAKLLEDLPKNYEKELEFCRNLEPEVIEPEILDNQLLELKARENELLKELANQKVELLNSLVESIQMRYGPSLKNDMEITKAKLDIEQVKAQLIKALLEENVNSMSDHVKQAMDKIEFYLDNAIAEKNAEASEKSDSKV